MFRIELLPAQRGDCIWLTYGPQDDLHHVIIDGGPSEVIPSLVPELERRISALPGEKDRVELLVETHIDADHIQGTVSLLSDPDRVELFGEVWFNGFPQITTTLGVLDAEAVTHSLLVDPTRWNASFDGLAVRVADDGSPIEKQLPGGLKLTILSPTRESLRRLLPMWEEAMGALAGKGVAPPRKWQRDHTLGGAEFPAARYAAEPYRPDRSLTNGSGISFIAEYGGKRALFLADVPAEQVLASFDKLGTDVQHFDAVKVSHHGSRNNTSLDLCLRIECPHWLISTNGAKFGHPHPQALGRIIVTQEAPTFHLNYVTRKVKELMDGAGDGYSVRTPDELPDGTFAEGVALDL